MKRHILTLIVGIIVGGGTFGAVGAFASTPKPSSYCTKKEVGKVVTYTTPSGSATYKLKCVIVPTQKWKKAV